jgi:hypothetical protein
MLKNIVFAADINEGMAKFWKLYDDVINNQFNKNKQKEAIEQFSLYIDILALNYNFTDDDLIYRGEIRKYLENLKDMNIGVTYEPIENFVTLLKKKYVEDIAKEQCEEAYNIVGTELQGLKEI